MRVEVLEESSSALEAYARVPIRFPVRRVLEAATPRDGLGGVVLSERRLEVPYLKDYDALDGGAPTEWPRRFDVSGWGFLAAIGAGERVGGATVAFRTPGMDMLEGRRDLAVLWDLRVSPEARGRGVGTALFEAAAEWATRRGCRQLKVETQNVNVPACEFYVRRGCVLGGINRFAYPGLPEEIQLLWYRELA